MISCLVMPRGSLKSVLFLCLGLFALPHLAAAQKYSVVPLVTSRNWRVLNSETLDLRAIPNWGGDPAIENEYGVKTLTHRTYGLEGVTADAIFEGTSDASSAYGLYTFYQTKSMAPEKGMQLAVSGPSGTLMARGRFFIRVFKPTAPPRGGAAAVRKNSPEATARQRISDADFLALLLTLGGARPAPEALAGLPAPLPAARLVPGSEKYLLGREAARRVLPEFPIDLIGFSQGAEAQTGTYLAGESRATVIAITYPNPQIARVRYGAFERFLALNQGQGAGKLFGRRSGSFVFLVSGVDALESANRLMDPFKVEQSFSWNQRYRGDESIWKQLAKLILANMALVGILISLAILGGFLVFLTRQIAAKWFPGSSWGHPDEGVIIRLNLS